MIVIYKNRGILVPVYLVVSLVSTSILNTILKKYIGWIFATNYDSQIVMGIGLVISGLWTYFTSEDHIMVDGEKEKIFMNNHFFYISMKLWSYIMLGFGVLTLLSGIVETITL
ncbi:hypothetical protein [uncultured Aquimarina sp.]|uniref:hypothetical protein n=1 Tax=uncultured Aquimarina sp. TaxID=575652 RepID=UPI00260EB350|nr:hypothetical protein [uncultured Aquimarina sp.]